MGQRVKPAVLYTPQMDIMQVWARLWGRRRIPTPVRRYPPETLEIDTVQHRGLPDLTGSHMSFHYGMAISSLTEFGLWGVVPFSLVPYIYSCRLPSRRLEHALAPSHLQRQPLLRIGRCRIEPYARDVRCDMPRRIAAAPTHRGPGGPRVI